MKWESIHKKNRWHKAKRANSWLKKMECLRVKNKSAQPNTILDMKKVRDKSFEQGIYMRYYSGQLIGQIVVEIELR